jgi:hypothetical protein
MHWEPKRNGEDIHMVTDDDVLDHVLGMSCWCRPARDEEDPEIVIHHCFYIGDVGEGLLPHDGIYH